MSEGAPTRYRWRLLRAGEFRLDGGAMFGLVPRVVWSRSVETDDRGRIRVQHNCLLLERVGAGDGPRLVVIEVGTGDKLDPKSRDIFALEDRSILEALHEADCSPESVDAVVVTHLHFDHAGGLTRRVRPGEKPDWVGPGSAGESAVKLSFPRATLHVQAREWADALADRSVMTRTYFRDHLEPMRERVRPVDSPRPFVTGTTPDRDALPLLTVEQRAAEILPGVRVLLAPGHTWGQQAVLFEDDTGRTIVFVPDVMPTVNHVGAAYSLGYDVEPYTSMLTRHWLLHEAATRRWTLVLDHEPGHAVHTVAANDRGWYTLSPAG